MIYLSPEIHIREQIPLLLCQKELKGYVVEIGVNRAVFSNVILSRWKHGTLIGIDPYVTYWEKPDSRKEDIKSCDLVRTYHQDRFVLFQEKSSKNLANDIVDTYGKPCLVYIDGDHKYKACKEDIDTWWPLICDGGILAGHDYTYRLPGVVRAVNEFSEEQDVLVTHENDWKSWYTYKNASVPVSEGYYLPIDKELLRDAAQ